MTARRHAAVVGVGSALPDRVVPNSFFEDFVDTSDEWIRERTGIRERRFAAEGQTTSDLAREAAEHALDAAAIAAEQIDLLVVATCTPDTPIPSTGVHVQRKLGISCPAFDVNSACAGFSYALSAGAAFIESGVADTVVVVGSEILSRVMDLYDRSTCVLFGDGAGAVVLRPSPEPGVIGSVLGADGTTADALLIPAGGTEHPASRETVEARDHSIRMPSGREVFKRAVVEMANACREVLEKSGYTPDDVDVLIPHQANARIMNGVAERLGITGERAVVDVAEVGNTSAASIPIALDRAWRAGRVRRGGLVLLTSFGAGLSWGANLVRWTAPEPTS
ncbi:MAG TPA: beta-ketoacyl-ACP synthase III [Actinomycetota bacterium]|nr:beta-ketoacyl-ACP synthase III [Actinomycetota bacterium]